MPTDLLRRMLFWGGLPLAAPQGWWLRRHAPRQPAAAGAECGVIGDGPPLRLLALGDSLIAGAGAGIAEHALPARFAAAIADRLGRSVHWRVLARTGADAEEVELRLLPRIGTGDIDLVLLAVGINDVTGCRTRAAFRRHLHGVLAGLYAHSPRCRVVVAGIPPLQGFPLLPQPLRFLLGQRSRTLDAVWGEVARQRPNVLHVPSPLPEAHRFAADGYHPNARCYAEWAELLADACTERWHRWRGEHVIAE